LRDGELEHVTYPFLRAAGIAHDADFDRGFDPLRIAVRANRQRGAGKLQQANEPQIGHLSHAAP
jgi:hypothetical protein